MVKKRRRWVVHIVVGGIIGAICSAIVAVNVAIWFGPDQGYQSSIGDVFEHSLPTGIVTVAILVAGPVIGVFVARRQRPHPTITHADFGGEKRRDSCKPIG